MICVISGVEQTDARSLQNFRSAMSNFTKQISENGVFFVLCFLVAATFIMGGSARSDVQSLALLRPLAIVVLGFWTLEINDRGSSQ